jgi:hypothetical protein
MSDGNTNLKIQLARELETAAKFQKVNQELYDYLIATIFWLLNYAEKYGLTPPNLNKLQNAINQIHLLMGGADSLYPLSPTFQHPSTTPRDSTEPIFI